MLVVYGEELLVQANSLARRQSWQLSLDASSTIILEGHLPYQKIEDVTCRGGQWIHLTSIQC